MKNHTTEYTILSVPEVPEAQQHNSLAAQLPSRVAAKRVAFTLAEVLITLAIIGVVAAMTIPTLIAKYEEKSIVSQLNKAYSSLSQAYLMVQTEYGSPINWGMASTNTGRKDENGNTILDYSGSELLAERMAKYLKVSKFCEIGTVCDNRAEYSLSNVLRKEEGTPETNRSNLVLQDGTVISFGYYSAVTKAGDISIAVPQGKTNVLGKNRFFFKYDIKGVHPEGSVDTPEPFSYCDPAYDNRNAGRGCTAWVIYNKKIDYLHCRADLGWDKKHSCKE